MKITLLGTGDSAGIPKIGCKCPTCERHRLEGRERTRFSVLVENNDERVLIDASPDLRTQFLREGIPSIDAVVLTHSHYDHYSGLGDLYRVIWDYIPVYGTVDVLEYVIDDRFYYLPFPKKRVVEPNEVFSEADMDFELVEVDHPPVNCYGVVITWGGVKVALTSDTSTEIPESSKEKMMDADLLIVDGFIPGSGSYNDFVESRISEDGMNFGGKHMTYEGAMMVADELNADETVVVHLSHYYREERDELGSDGQTFEFRD